MKIFPDPSPGPEREMLTVKQAMRRAEVSRSTIQSWLRLDKIASVQTAGGRGVRIYADSLFLPRRRMRKQEP